MKKIILLLSAIFTVSLLLILFVVYGPKLLPVFINKPIEPQTQQPLVTQETQSSQSATQLSQQMDPELFQQQEKNKHRLTQGCLSGKDCIPALNVPKFVSIQQATKFLKDDDLVMGIAFEGWEHEDDPVKAYPVKILERHQIVNDYLNETPIVVTYCPLCHSGAVYRSLDGGASMTFGVSGDLLNSNLVMYDVSTDTLWSQLQGDALIGPMYPKRLESVPMEITSWKDWKSRYTTSVVLSDQTGLNFDYSMSPYVEYVKSPKIEFAVEHSDSRLSNKDMVYSVQLYDQAKSYPVLTMQKTYSKGGSFDDLVGGHPVHIDYSGNTFKVTDSVTKKAVPVTLSYWFCWVAMHEHTEIFTPEILKQSEV